MKNAKIKTKRLHSVSEVSLCDQISEFINSDEVENIVGFSHTQNRGTLGLSEYSAIILYVPTNKKKTTPKYYNGKHEKSEVKLRPPTEVNFP